MSVNDIINRHKKHLTNAQVHSLVKLSNEYKQLNAGRRAEAYGDLYTNHQDFRRGLQNMGLASRRGNIISGREVMGQVRVDDAYHRFNDQLNVVEDKMLDNAAERMRPRYVPVQQQKVLPPLPPKTAATNVKNREDNIAWQWNTNEKRLQLTTETQYNPLENAKPPAPANQRAEQMEMRKRGYMNPVAENAQVYHERQARTAQRTANVQDAVTQAFDNANRAANPAAYAALEVKYAAKQKALADNTARWDREIADGDKIAKDDPEYKLYKNRSEKARREKANAQSSLYRTQLAMNLPADVGTLVAADDADFAVRYSAAETLYKVAVENAKKAKGKSASDDQNAYAVMRWQNAEDELKKATDSFAKFEQAKAYRNATTPMDFYVRDIKVDESLVPKTEKWVKPREWNGSNFKAAFAHGWEADDYAKKNDTKGSKYAALVNDWSLVNGRTALLYSQDFQVTKGFLNVADFFTEVIGKGGTTRDSDHNRFLGECVMAYKGDYESSGTKSEKEQMDAMLTLANLMTDEERATFNTILNRSGAGAADEYFKHLYNDVLPARFSEYVHNEQRFDTRDTIGKVRQSLFSVPVNLTQGVTGVAHTMTTQQDDPVAAMIGARKYNTAQSMRDVVSEDMSEFGKFAYGTGMSMADSMTVAAISGGIGSIAEGLGASAALAGKIGSTLGGSLLGGSAFNSAYSEAIDRGLSPDKARATALGQGINEMLFEAVSLDLVVSQFQHGGVLKVAKNRWVNWAVNAGVSAGVEGSEELTTDVANELWDKYINGIYSEELTKLREYIGNGMSYEDAKAQVQKEFDAQLGMSFLGGAVSGGIMGGGASILGTIYNRDNAKFGHELRKNTRVMDELKGFDYKSETAQDILTQSKLTDEDVSDLFNIRQQELLEQNIDSIKEAVKNGTITQEDADLLNRYKENGVQIVKDGKVTENENGITAEEYDRVQEIIPKLQNGAEIQFLNNEEMREMVNAAGGEVAAAVDTQQTQVQQAERTYQDTVNSINADATLTDEQKSAKIAEAKTARAQAVSAANKQFDTTFKSGRIEVSNGSVKVSKGSGSVTFDYGSRNTLDSMTANEASALRIAKVVASRGVNVKMESEFTGVMKDGTKRNTLNGYYDKETNTIHVNLSGNNSVLWTVSHELTHYLAAQNTQAYEDLRSAIESKLKEQNLTASELNLSYDMDRVVKYINKTENLYDALVEYEKARGYESDAEEEVIARCCESFLANRIFVQSFAKKNYKSAKAISAFLTQMNTDMRRVFDDAMLRATEKGIYNDMSPEQEILSQVADIDDIARLWSNAVNKVGKTVESERSVKASTMDNERASTMDDVKLSDKAYNVPQNVRKYQAEFIGKTRDKNGYAVHMFYRYRGREYMVTDEHNGYSEPMWVKHKNEQERIDREIEELGKERREGRKEQKYEGSGQEGFDLFWDYVENGEDRFSMMDDVKLSERFNNANDDIRFSMMDEIERKGDLIAVHNLTGDQLLKSIDIGGFPMPSIAVIKPSYGHNRYGDVSVIFNKDTIDPKRSSANKVYGGDAWTPTYPSVEYKASKAVRDRVYKKYSELSKKFGYDNVREMYKYAEEIEKQLNSYRGEQALLEHLYDDTDMMRIYQQDAGKNRTDDVYIEDRHEMDKDERELSQKFIDILGEDVVRQYATPKGENPFEHRREFIKAHRADIEKAWGKILRDSSFDDVQAILDNTSDKDYHGIMIRCLNLLRDGGVRVDRKFDPKATEQAIRKDTDQKAYRKWIDDLFKGAAEKSGIRNTKGYYTESGYPRTWEALHEEETLDNVVRVMRQMSDKASNTIFNKSEMLAIGTRNFKSIDDIRKHKDQLKHISDEEMEAAKTNIVNGFYDLSEELRNKNEKNHFIGRDQALEAMVEAVKKSRTPQGILNELRQWHGLNVTNDMGQRIADLMEEIANLPTEYFEAKPKRAVRIDEIKAVVLPRGEYSELEAKLAENGIPAVEYEKDNDEDRLRALNSDVVSAQRFSTMDNIKLNRNGNTRTFELKDTKATLIGNDVELDGGTIRQRVAMMKLLAEHNDKVRVDAASAEEAEAFKRAGAEQVEEELEGRGAEYGTWEFKYQRQPGQDIYDPKQKVKFAKDIVKQVGSGRGFTAQQKIKYNEALGRLMDKLYRMQYGNLSGHVVFDYAERVFDNMLDDYTAMDKADEEFRSDILANLSKTKDGKGRTYYVLEVNENQMQEIKYAYENAKTYANKLSTAIGARVTVKQVENASMLEDMFNNSTDTRFNSDTNEGDMPNELIKLARETEARKTHPYKGMSEERMATKEAMFEAAMNAAGVEKTAAQKVREAVKEARAEERAKARERMAKRDAKLKAEFKDTVARREAKLKAEFKETTAKRREEQLKRDMRKVALKWNQRLVKMLANPTEASHVPVQLAKEVAALTKAVTEYMDKGTERGRINLDKLIKAYQRAFDDQATIAEAQKENPNYDPRGQVLDKEMYDEQLVAMINELNEVIGNKSFKDMSAYEMRMLLNTVRGVCHTVYEANRMIGTEERKAIWKVGSQMVNQMEATHVSEKMRGYLETSLDLRRIAKIFSNSDENAEFVKLVDQLNKGAIEKERVAQVLQDMFKPVTDQYGDEISKWYGKKAEWIDTGIVKNGHKIEITKGMRVSLAMHVMNSGNMNHIENGGLTIPNRELYNKGRMADAYANGELVRLNKEQINEIISHMTEAEKAYVAVASEFFHKRTGYFVNKTSLQLLGYRKAIVDKYFPIHTDKNFTKTDFASLKMDGSIEGQGFLKERVNASNPVYLEDITSVVNRQIRGVALYAGLAVPMRNFNAVMNAAVYEDDNGVWSPRTTVKQTMTKQMGEYGAKVVQGFLTDVSEMSHVDVTPMERFAGKLATNYVKAVLLGNLKVAMKQVASYPTAAAVIPWKYLAKALVAGGRNNRMISRANVDLINQYTPLYQMRRAGQANEIASIMQRRGMEDKLPWLLGWITKMDVMTVGRLWSAAEYMVADQQRNLVKGSDAYYKAVAQVFNDTVQQTQPNFTPLQRNAALRSKNPIVRSLVLFGTQRMQNGGIMLEAAYELKQSKGKSPAEIKAAKMKLGRAVASQIIQNVLLIVASLGVDALRGRMKSWQDEDKDITMESLAKGMGDMFLSNAIGSFLGGSEVYSLLSGLYKKATDQTAYDTEFTVPALDAAETLINFAQSDIPNLIKYLTGDHSDEEKMKKAKTFSFALAKAFGYATGIPLENVLKDVFKGIIPAIEDHKEWLKTGEFTPWLHQSGKLDKQKTAANYKEWTNEGFKGSTYFYWEDKMKDVTGGRKNRIPLLLESDLTNEQKAMILRMVDTSGATSEGTVVYKSNGNILIDFANPDGWEKNVK